MSRQVEGGAKGGGWQVGHISVDAQDASDKKKQHGKRCKTLQASIMEVDSTLMAQETSRD